MDDVWEKEVALAMKRLRIERPKLMRFYDGACEHGETIGVRVKILISLFQVLCTACSNMRAALACASTRILSRAWHAFLQVLAGIGLVFAINYPPMYKMQWKMIGTITFIDMNLPSLAPMGCLYEVSFFNSLLMKTALPAFLCSSMVIAGSLMTKYCVHETGDNMDLDNDGVVTREEYFKAQPVGKALADLFSVMSFYLLFLVDRRAGHTRCPQLLPARAQRARCTAEMPAPCVPQVYPNASTTVLQFFVCDSFSELGEDQFMYLRIDLSIDCEGDAYMQWMNYAIAMIICYPFGVPLLYMMILFRSRHALWRMKRFEVESATNPKPKPRP